MAEASTTRYRARLLALPKFRLHHQTYRQNELRDQGELQSVRHDMANSTWSLRPTAVGTRSASHRASSRHAKAQQENDREGLDVQASDNLQPHRMRETNTARELESLLLLLPHRRWTYHLVRSHQRTSGERPKGQPKKE